LILSTSKELGITKQHHQRLQLNRECQHPTLNSLGTNENLDRKTANPKDGTIIKKVVIGQVSENSVRDSA
jgi:hypothetical protein